MQSVHFRGKPSCNQTNTLGTWHRNWTYNRRLSHPKSRIEALQKSPPKEDYSRDYCCDHWYLLCILVVSSQIYWHSWKTLPSRIILTPIRSMPGSKWALLLLYFVRIAQYFEASPSVFHHGVSTRIHSSPNTQWPRCLGRSTCCVQEARVSMIAVKGFLALIKHCPRFFWQQKFVQKMRTKHNQRMSFIYIYYMYIYISYIYIFTKMFLTL